MKVQVTMVSVQVRRKTVEVEVAKLSLAEKAAMKASALTLSEGTSHTFKPWQVVNIEVVGVIEDLTATAKPKYTDPPAFGTVGGRD